MKNFSYKNLLYIALSLLVISCTYRGPYAFVSPNNAEESSSQYWSIFQVDYSLLQEEKRQLDKQRNIIFCQNQLPSCSLEEIPSKEIENISDYKVSLNSDLSKRYSFDELKGKTFNYGFNKVRFFKSGFCGENGSCYGDISAATGRAKTVFVNGYSRSDGTYVRSHYRSPPSKK
jgi:hypothetical protein